MLDVTDFGILDALPGNRQELVARPVLDGAHGARLGASRRLALGLQVGALIALFDQRKLFLPFEGGDSERAGIHAIPAADTAVGVVHYGTIGQLLQSPNGTRGD